MKLAIPVLLAVAATPAYGATLPCLDLDRDAWLSALNERMDGNALDILGPITETRPGVCKMRVLMTNGVHEIVFELRTVQGKQYFHKFSERMVGGPQ